MKKNDHCKHSQQVYQIFLIGMTFIFSFLLHATEKQDPYLPVNILMMDPRFSHHVLVVEKASHKLHLYENSNTIPKLIKSYNSATGKFRGNKRVSGDHKTPEGIYVIDDFLSENELQKRHGKLAKIYGPGAFPMNYPNLMDIFDGKGGNGIWLHSTDDDSRISKGLDSRGCVVVKQDDIKDISQFIELKHTPIIVVQDLYHLPLEIWEKNREELRKTIDTWMKAWQEKDFKTYISLYDPKKFRDRRHKNFFGYKAYKNAVFSRKDKPEIKFNFLSILFSKDYAKVQIEQNYKSDIINDTGKKTLYLKKDTHYDWKIVAETWEKLEPHQDQVAFKPSMKFFSSETTTISSSP